MAMQGKSTSGDEPSLDVDEAELAANAFRPSWDAEDFGSDAAPVAAPAGAAMASTLLDGSASMPNVPEQGAPILSEVVPLGSGDANETAPFRSQPKVPAAKPADSTQLGVNPPPGPEASPETAGLVVAPAPSAEALDSASVVEAPPSIPHAPVTAPLPKTPDSSPSVGLRAAGPMTATGSARAAAVTQASAAKPKAAAAYAAADPFRHPVPAPESAGDLNFVRKPSSKGIVFTAIGVVALVAIGLFVKFGSASPEEPETKGAARTSGPAVPAPANDIPPPPPKDETTPPKTAATLASEATPVPSPAKAAESLPPRAEPSTPKTTANAPTHSELKPKAAPVTPKTPPKATGGGIVRDSPF